MTTTLQHNAQQQPQSSNPAAGKQHDEFDSDAFEQQHQSLPYLQLLNHQDPD